MPKASSQPRFIVDSSGRPVAAVVSIAEYRRMIEQLEDLDDVRAYDRAKKSKSKAVPLEQALREIERKRRK